MIRELTKSALSFSWAMSLLGLKQAVNLGRPAQNGGDLFGPVTQVAVGQLDESMKGLFRSGDNLQSRAVDIAFSWLNPGNLLNPGRWLGVANWANPVEWISPDTWMRAAGSLTQAASGCCGQGQRTGQQQAPAGSPGAGSGSGAPGGAAPVSNESAAAGWGPMPPSPS